jgi:glycosyltransferase involved in cell wall biosynthesis
VDLSIIIPSRNEEFLQKTVDDIFNKARGSFEVVVILDENDQPMTPRDGLRVIKKVGKPGLRSAMNQAIEASQGKYIMKTDAHCMFGEGFDTILEADMEDNWVVIPRRYSLIPETWEINPHRPIIDYEYYVFPYRNEEAMSVKTGGKWHDKAAAKKDVLIDDEMAFQGSCWFTTKEHLKNIEGFSINTSTGDEFVLESEELANKTWLSGGMCKVNKKTWYAHLHKGSRGRGYFINKWPMKKQRLFHTDYWMHDRWPKAIYKMKWMVDHFWPIPGWPEDWQDPKYEESWKKANGI